jgi:uncharacterized NAD-dependent epimerase/dehydratase family protein
VTKTTKLMIAAHAVIVGLALVVGYLNAAAYGLRCFYAQQPFGSACEAGQGALLFWIYAGITAAILYGLWGAVVVLRRLTRQAMR